MEAGAKMERCTRAAPNQALECAMKRDLGMDEGGNSVVPCGCTGTPGAVGAQRRRPLYEVSSMPLKGTVSWKQASERRCLAETFYGAST